VQTSLPADLLATDDGRTAERILRSCVHCGFCLATCPTYLVERNELDSPRGRIELLRSVLEGETVSAITRGHLDRCLICRACETTCPSGVDYHSLLAIGQRQLAERLPRARGDALRRRLIRAVVPQRRLLRALVGFGQWLRPVMPATLRGKLPARRRPLPGPAPLPAHSRRVLLVQGCAQPALSPNTQRAAEQVLARLGIRAVTVAAETCCGALDYHLDALEAARRRARANLDAWAPLLAEEDGVEAIVMTATGCSNFVQDYPDLLADDPDYAPRAARVGALLKDIATVLVGEDLADLRIAADGVALHLPCSAQHGQVLGPVIREVLLRLGFTLLPVADEHLCCGSAGAYSLLQPKLSEELRARRLSALLVGQPTQIVTANIGCQLHLGVASPVPVTHWLEALAARLD